MNRQNYMIGCENLTLAYEATLGEPDAVLDGVNLHVAPGEIVVILGPSGCGKSTLLRVLAGVLSPTEGQVFYWPESGPNRPRIPVVEQTPALLPWKNVEQNVRVFADVAKSNLTDEKVHALLSRVRLQGFEGLYPASLSGGMSIRVALARALAVADKVLLLDEAFSSLDEVTRLHLLADICKHAEAQNLAILAVNHNIEEAVLMGDRVIVLSPRPAKVVYEFVVPIVRPRPLGSDAFAQVLEVSAHIREKVAEFWSDAKN